MENQIKRRKRQETHKVAIDISKYQEDCHQISEIKNGYFPYAPYPQQATLINKIYEAVMKSQNALVESPTGTGKTLCMLVSSLSALATLSSMQNSKVPKIYYLTRTHSQITQVVNQLKRIPWYKCKINVIASREHLCINRNLKQLKGRMLDRGCQEVCKQKLCKFKEQSNTQNNKYSIKQWLTLDQLCAKGSKNNFCPFYATKAATEKSQLTIMPFNYMLDWALFQHNNFNLKNSIIVFDQAHNIDSLAQQGSSLEIDTEILFQVLTELKNLEQSSKCRYLHKKFQSQINDKNASTFINQAKSLVSSMLSSLKQFVKQKNYHSLGQIVQTLTKTTKFRFQQQIFQGINLDNYEELLFNMQKVKKLFYQKKLQCEQFQLLYITLTRIMKLLDSNINIQDYYLYIGPKNTKTFTLKLNCLNASFTFQRIMQHKPRSLILCSGTLGPFQLWQRQLGVIFFNKIKVPSFITPLQICANIVCQSLDKKTKYQFSYQHKNREEQFVSLVGELKQIQKIVPNGVVVAFSTYELMQKVMKLCLDLKKEVFYQSKNQSVEHIYSKFSQSAKTKNGAFLFIVMKGKFGEGINFSDQLCRCLVVVGIPFLPPNDFKVMKKKDYIYSKFGREAAEQWYYSQTFKAVNQVIGRIIRSKKDYGSVLLFDQRYERKDILKELPLWFSHNLPKGHKPNYIQRMNQFFQKQTWLNIQQETKKKESKNLSFQHILSKTILANDNTQQIRILQNLLNQQTPVKPKKAVKKLKILSQDQLPQEDKQILNKGEIKNKFRQINNGPKLSNALVSTIKMPWLSLNYFIDDHYQDYLQQTACQQTYSQPANIENESEEVRLRMVEKKKKKYV